MERLEEDCKKMNDKMDEEKINRIVKMAELKDTLYQDMKIQNDHIDSFQQHTREALTDMKNGIVEELRSRLDHQDEMLDNLSKFIGTFQSTLKIIGKDI